MTERFLGQETSGDLLVVSFEQSKFLWRMICREAGNFSNPYHYSRSDPKFREERDRIFSIYADTVQKIHDALILVTDKVLRTQLSNFAEEVSGERRIEENRLLRDALIQPIETLSTVRPYLSNPLEATKDLLDIIHFGDLVPIKFYNDAQVLSPVKMRVLFQGLYENPMGDILLRDWKSARPHVPFLPVSSDSPQVILTRPNYNALLFSSKVVNQCLDADYSTDTDIVTRWLVHYARCAHWVKTKLEGPASLRLADAAPHPLYIGAGREPTLLLQRSNSLALDFPLSSVKIIYLELIKDPVLGVPAPKLERFEDIFRDPMAVMEQALGHAKETIEFADEQTKVLFDNERLFWEQEQVLGMR